MTRRLVVYGLLLGAFAQIHTAAAQTFPRLGAVLVGGNTTGLTPAHVAPLGVVALGAYQGWKSNQGLNVSQFAAAAKAINPNFRLFVYSDINEAVPSSLPSDLSIINNVPWWLTTSGTGGTHVASSFGGGNMEINTTTYSVVHNGQNYPTWRAQRDVGAFVTPFPAVDGLFVDNVFSAPRVDGDYTLSGGSQSKTNATTQHIYRQGYVAYFNAVRAASGSSQQMIIGNIADWYENPLGMADVSDYQGILNGGVIESIIGQSYSIESYAGWATMMAAYSATMNALAAPKLAIFAQDGSATDYQGFRYGFASCLLGNGYYAYDANGNYNDYVTFDEFSVNLGDAVGSALVFPGAAAWQKGVYRRDFQNGIVLVNPKGNGPQTVTLETTYKHISGTQAPSVNNGQSVTTVTLNDRDGVVLLRGASQPVPDPPTLTVQ